MELNRRELALQRQSIAAKEAELNDEKRKLAVERLQFEAEKKLSRAGQEVPVAVVPPHMSIAEQESVPRVSEEEDVYIKQEPGHDSEVCSYSYEEPNKQSSHVVRDPVGQYDFTNLEGTTILPRKEIFPSWTWADWRPRTGLYGGAYTTSHHLKFPYQDSSFTCLVDLSVELDDGRIVSWGQGYDSDVLWLTSLPKPPRILHIQGYTANPQLRYMTEEDWADFHERTILPTKEAHAHGGNGRNPNNHSCSDDRDSRRWIFLDADGQHLQLPLELTRRGNPWCWGFRNKWYGLSTDAYHLQRQRVNQAETIKPYTESTFDFRVILLGYNWFDVFYMVLMRTTGTDSQTETFERVNVLGRMHLSSNGRTEPAKVVEFLAKLTGKHAESFRGTPWTKMNTRVA